jgi:hypothetical protein
LDSWSSIRKHQIVPERKQHAKTLSFDVKGYNIPVDTIHFDDVGNEISLLSKEGDKVQSDICI